MLARLSPLLAAAYLTAPWSSAAEEAPIYQSHFEDGLNQAASFKDWKLSDSGESGSIQLIQLGEAESAAGSPAALRIECEATEAPFRIAQSVDLFRLDPERPYILRVTLRVSRLDQRAKAQVRFFVTDSRWQWSSPSLLIKEPQSEWHTLELPFAAPAVGGPFFRVRFDALQAALQIEVAKVSILPDTPHP